MKYSANKKIPEFLFCDCDGVLTDALCHYSPTVESRSFSIYDGTGFRILSENGIKCYIISSDRTGLCRDRAKHLDITYLDARSIDKLSLIKGIIGDAPYIYIGDDLNDHSAIKYAEISFAPSSAPIYTKDIVDNVLPIEGGKGIVLAVALYMFPV